MAVKGGVVIKNKYMIEAIIEAKKADESGECPIGAVIVRNGDIIACGFNLKESEQNPVLHAEIVTIQKACKALGTWHLDDCDLYVTLEPCVMCAGAIIQSRIRRLYFGAYDLKAGATGSIVNIFDIKEFNHSPEIFAGIMEDECSALIKQFFRRLR